jgi:hypothetical protein
MLSLTNQRSWFEVKRLQHHQQIKAHAQHMVIKHDWKGEKVVMLFGQRNSDNQRKEKRNVSLQ